MPVIAIGKFHELRRPHLDGGRKNQWCTYADKNGMYYLLNGVRHNLCDIGNLDDIGAEIHFVTEAECHEAAAEYYNKHCLFYPYMREWRESRDLQGAALNVGVESQVMRFK